MLGMLRWAGDENPVETIVTLMQSGWRERFRVILTVMRKVPEPLDDLKSRLEANGWGVSSGDGHVEATLDMDTELFMPPTMTVQGMQEKAGAVAERVVGGMSKISVASGL
jgi:hypothetical protein